MRGDVCEIHEDNWDTVLLFLDCATQWRVAIGMGGALWLGLDYAAVAALMQMRGLARARRAALLADLQIMERAALAVLNAPGAARTEAKR